MKDTLQPQIPSKMVTMSKASVLVFSLFLLYSSSINAASLHPSIFITPAYPPSPPPPHHHHAAVTPAYPPSQTPHHHHHHDHGATPAYPPSSAPHHHHRHYPHPPTMPPVQPPKPHTYPPPSPPVKAPAHPPVKAPAYSPVPAKAPMKPPVAAPRHHPPTYPPAPTKAPTKPPVAGPSHPVLAPYSPMPRKFVAVEGVVYCKSCNYSGIDTLLGASPLHGATVELRCRNTVYTIKEAARTDKNGYFFMEAPKLITTYGAHKCRVFLVAPPKHSPCAHPTNLHGGAAGALLIPQPPKPLPFAVYSVGPLAFEPPKCPKP